MPVPPAHVCRRSSGGAWRRLRITDAKLKKTDEKNESADGYMTIKTQIDTIIESTSKCKIKNKL